MIALRFPFKVILWEMAMRCFYLHFKKATSG